MEAPNVQHVRTYKIEISGLVQGVGFRPFICILAQKLGISGWVENRNDGVVVLMNGTKRGVGLFKNEIMEKAPPASDIESLTITPLPDEDFQGFMIRQSEDLSERVTEISPDIAVCPDCLSDMKSQPHRINYPLINCTHCGPRFSIIRALPYDRPYTTMDAFTMCPVCRAEYENGSDRRFHAQPVACNRCGPVYSLNEHGLITESLDEILSKVSSGISRGALYALKGVGGFHLMCDAFNETAVSHLRSVKQRDGKPFALMIRSLDKAHAYVEINEEEKRLLLSWQRPVVLLKRKKTIAPGIADGLSTLGIMLPFMPFHYLLFDALRTDGIVLTSGNFSDEPILISNQEAVDQFGERVDGIISYNREIFNRSDDSVVMAIEKIPQILRRSRGYAPAPIRTHTKIEGIFAAGAELVSSFAMGKGNHVFMSQYIGDLKNYETYHFYEESFRRFQQLFRFTPRLLVHDLHPDYLSTKFARDLSEEFKGIPILPVQHHHAHIASVMLNHGLDGEVIGFAFDGLGLGDDGNLWGAEAMIVSYSDYRRMYHFEYMPMPGGDKASKESWRMALSYLYKCYGSGFQELPLPVFEEVGEREVEIIRNLIDRSLNTPLISSSGRLFDAVSAILGINYRATFQAEAPMKLESVADSAETGIYPYEIRNGQVYFQSMIRSLVEDLSKGIPRGRISGKFHNTLSILVLELAMVMRKETGLNRVVLSGGSFQNRIFTGKSYKLLSKEGFKIYLPDKVPLNDQGIALGQIAVGAARSSVL